MSTVQELLAPIEGERRGGVDITYETDYSEIAALREFDQDNNPKPDYGEIAELSASLLKERSKDLPAAIWYADAMMRVEGFGGLDSGLRLIHGLLDGFWDCLFPQEAQDR